MSEFAPESPDEYWAEVGTKVLGELNRRLTTTEARELPGTLLMRLAEQYMKHLEKKQQADAEMDMEWLTPLQAIDQEGLPVESKIEILAIYMDQLQKDHQTATIRLLELQKEVSDAETLHEPEPSPV